MINSHKESRFKNRSYKASCLTRSSGLQTAMQVLKLNTCHDIEHMTKPGNRAE